MMMMEIIGKYEKHKSSHGAYHFNQIDQGSECGSEKRGEWEKIIILILKSSESKTKATESYRNDVENCQKYKIYVQILQFRHSTTSSFKKVQTRA